MRGASPIPSFVIPAKAGIAPDTHRQVARDPSFRWDDGVRIAGYAAVFGRTDMGGDVVLRGAFACDIAQRREWPLLLQHDAQHRIGTVTHLCEDGRGLRVVATVTDARAAAMVRAGALAGLSFGYRVRSSHGTRPRRLIDLALIEISLVTHPMQPLARLVAFTS